MSVLSPTLFTIFTGDSPPSTASINISYADDITQVVFYLGRSNGRRRLPASWYHPRTTGLGKGYTSYVTDRVTKARVALFNFPFPGPELNSSLIKALVLPILTYTTDPDSCHEQDPHQPAPASTELHPPLRCRLQVEGLYSYGGPTQGCLLSCPQRVPPPSSHTSLATHAGWGQEAVPHPPGSPRGGLGSEPCTRLVPKEPPHHREGYGSYAAILLVRAGAWWNDPFPPSVPPVFKWPVPSVKCKKCPVQ